MAGIRFLRQYTVGHYILDFYAPAIHLAIEIDGKSHEGKYCYDKHREFCLKDLGFIVLRINDIDVKQNLENVQQGISKTAETIRNMK